MYCRISLACFVQHLSSGSVSLMSTTDKRRLRSPGRGSQRLSAPPGCPGCEPRGSPSRPRLGTPRQRVWRELIGLWVCVCACAGTSAVSWSFTPRSCLPHMCVPVSASVCQPWLPYRRKCCGKRLLPLSLPGSQNAMINDSSHLSATQVLGFCSSHGCPAPASEQSPLSFIFFFLKRYKEYSLFLFFPLCFSFWKP